MKVIFRCIIFLQLLLIAIIGYPQTNPNHVKVNGYYKNDGTYVQPYFRTAPNYTNVDNFSTKGNTNPYTGKPGWIDPDSDYNSFYYNTYEYNSKSTDLNKDTEYSLFSSYKERTYIQDEFGNYSHYLVMTDERTFEIYDITGQLVLYLVINHRGDWRIFDSNMIYIKTIFVVTEK